MKILETNNLFKKPSIEKCDEIILFSRTEHSREMAFSNIKA